jgi:AcrR family transcriptional regulator
MNYDVLVPRRYSMESRKEENAARRRRLIDAAIEVLGEVGAERLTMELVADRADTATRTLYNHFASRDELISEAFAVQLEFIRDLLANDVPGEGDARTKLNRFVEVLFGVYVNEGQSLTTLMNHREIAEVDMQIRNMRDWRRQQLERILRTNKTKLRIPLAHAVALSFVMTNHAAWKALIDETSLSPAKVIAMTTDALGTVIFTD